VAVQELPEDLRLREHAARRRLAARAVPAQRLGADAARLLEPAAKRPREFYRGNDVYDPRKVGFVSGVPAQGARKFFPFYTRTPGNSNAGHDGKAYGTELPPGDKDALVEYLKTF
jgi:hypothetical protein